MDYWRQQLPSENLPYCTLKLGVAIAIALICFKRTRPSGPGHGSHQNYWIDRVHPELKAPPTITIDSWWKVYLLNMLNLIPCKTMPGVKMTKVKGIGVYYHPANNSKDHEDDAPAQMIMWIHGGGRIVGSAANFAECLICSKIVLMFGVPVLAADYRKPSKHPFPAALDDIHRAYHWLAKKVRGGGRIAVSGLSAGGGLAAELCQRLLDEHREGGHRCELVPLPACQLLLDPMLDDRTCVNGTVLELPPHILWNAKSNLFAWSQYLGPHHEPGSVNLPKYASASRREDLSGLPPALILVGELDLFHEECTKYARRLIEHGVETEFVVTEGGFHAFMSMSPNDGPAVECWGRFHAFGKRFMFDQIDS
ncbi:hypothetical protein ACHAXA_007945 [Cyclostephanos tholiformis]|jgi:acetyl esterase/lipase|uniref:Alpha/beta hydrolase fold-3 domain-containing protein n=1 Tax=Cyclostephanos tholiformis TaxID=382380 RepID=A0ABD3R3U8_9STRA